MKKVAILQNILSPYRVSLFNELSTKFQVQVLISGKESNRRYWHNSEVSEPLFVVKESWGVKYHITEKRDGSPYKNWHLHFNPGYIYDLFKFNPHVVISNEMGPRSLLALLYGRLTGTPVCIWWGGTLHTERGIGLLRKAIRNVFRLSVNHWISYGETSTDYLKELGVSSKYILQIQNCVDRRRFEGASSGVLSPSVRPALLFVGQLINRKGVEALLRAAAELSNKGYKFSLHIVGDGQKREYLTKLRDKLDLDNVHFHGAFLPEEMPSIYSSVDALVFPSLEDVWGLVVNEALWSGLPVLGSVYSGSSVELLPPENVIDPLDGNDLVRGLKRTVEGELAPPDTSRLLGYEEVADRLTAKIFSIIGS